MGRVHYEVLLDSLELLQMKERLTLFYYIVNSDPEPQTLIEIKKDSSLIIFEDIEGEGKFEFKLKFHNSGLMYFHGVVEDSRLLKEFTENGDAIIDTKEISITKRIFIN